MFYRFLKVQYCSLNIKLNKLVDILSFLSGDNVKCGLVRYIINLLTATDILESCLYHHVGLSLSIQRSQS